MKTLPCKNCLVLVMCRSKVEVKPHANRSTVWGVIYMLSLTCPELKDYVKPNESYNYDINHRRLAVHFLTGIDLGGSKENEPIALQKLYNFCHM